MPRAAPPVRAPREQLIRAHQPQLAVDRALGEPSSSRHAASIPPGQGAQPALLALPPASEPSKVRMQHVPGLPGDLFGD